MVPGIGAMVQRGNGARHREVMVPGIGAMVPGIEAIPAITSRSNNVGAMVPGIGAMVYLLLWCSEQWCQASEQKKLKKSLQ